MSAAGEEGVGGAAALSIKRSAYFVDLCFICFVPTKLC